MNRRRLREAAKFLREVVEKFPPEKFDMYIWARGEKPKRMDGSCNTVACAAGWLTLRFKKEGLKLTKRGTEYEPYYKGGRAALERFFRLGADDVEDIFTPWRYLISPIRPHHVADKIDQLLKEATSK